MTDKQTKQIKKQLDKRTKKLKSNLDRVIRI